MASSIRGPQIRPAYSAPGQSPKPTTRRKRAGSAQRLQKPRAPSSVARTQSARPPEDLLPQVKRLRTRPLTRLLAFAIPVVFGAAVMAFACTSIVGGAVLIALAIAVTGIYLKMRHTDSEPV